MFFDWGFQPSFPWLPAKILLHSTRTAHQSAIGREEANIFWQKTSSAASWMRTHPYCEEVYSLEKMSQNTK